MKLAKYLTSTALLPVAVAAIALPAQAQTSQSPFDGVTIINDCDVECDLPSFSSAAELVSFMSEATQPGGPARAGAGGSPEGANGPAGIGLGLGLGLNSPQTVFVSFETGDPTFSGTLFGVPFTLPDHVYTQAERDEVVARIAADYAPFNFEFTQEEPTSGDFVTLQFNSNDDPGNGTAGILPTGGILFGSAGEIDFGNDNRSITAINDANFWTALANLDPFFGFPPGGILELFSGIDVDTDGPGPDTGLSLEDALSLAIVNQSANTGAHELGHGVGLRHYDAFGPIGGGLPSTGIPDPVSFFPVFAGPQEGVETTLHLMASGASSGLDLEGSGNADRFFSERSAIKLAINERGRFVTDDQANRGQAKLKRLQVVNTVLEGETADLRLDVDNIVIEGTIEELDEVDSFTFSGRAGDIFNAEMISQVESGGFDALFGRLTLFSQDRRGNLTEIASNDDEFESFDAFLIDVILPESGTYVLQFDAPDTVQFDITGDGIPETVELALFGDATVQDIRLGQYIVNAYIVDTKNGNGPSSIGGPSGNGDSGGDNGNANGNNGNNGNGNGKSKKK